MTDGIPSVTEKTESDSELRTRYEPRKDGTWLAIVERRNHYSNRWRQVGQRVIESIAFENIPPEMVDHD